MSRMTTEFYRNKAAENRHEIARLLEEKRALQAADCWIPVEERLPPHQQCVLTWPPTDELSDWPSISWYDHDEDMPGWHGPDIFDEPDPTHWRPLPAPPEPTN